MAASTIQLRSPREIERMRPACELVRVAHEAVREQIRVGVTTGELNQIVEELFAKHNAIPLFKGFPGPIPFPAATCISINDEVVHGIPGDRRLIEGDLVSIDTGCRLHGWCGDAAVTHAVGNVSPEARRLLEVTHETLKIAIELTRTCRFWSEVAREMESTVEREGFSVVRQLAGHGIGRNLHESPSVPNFTSQDSLKKDFALRPGLVIAIEPMVNAGRAELETLSDQWTQVTVDGSLSAHFEHTVAITQDGPLVMTGA